MKDELQQKWDKLLLSRQNIIIWIANTQPYTIEEVFECYDSCGDYDMTIYCLDKSREEGKDWREFIPKKTDHPSDLIEKGKHYDKVVEALKIATEYLQSKSGPYHPGSATITQFNKILKESEVYL